MKGYYQKSLIIRTPEPQYLNESYNLIEYLSQECKDSHIYDYEIVSISCLYNTHFIVILNVFRGE